VAVDSILVNGRRALKKLKGQDAKMPHAADKTISLLTQQAKPGNGSGAPEFHYKGHYSVFRLICAAIGALLDYE